MFVMIGDYNVLLCSYYNEIEFLCGSSIFYDISNLYGS